MTREPIFKVHDISSSGGIPNSASQQWPKRSLSAKINDITVFYSEEQDGGGSIWAEDFVLLIQHLHGNRQFDNCFEWCSGPGFIGFSMLAHDICTNLYLGDIYQPALDNCELTRHNLDKKYQQRTIKTLNVSAIDLLSHSYQFDLIVANPPHFDTVPRRTSNYYDPRLFVDKDWQIHQNFFANIKKNLTPDGVIVLLESFWGSDPETFAHMIDESGLKITRYIDYDCYTGYALYPLYYLEITHK